jgi:hypothetical protein
MHSRCRRPREPRSATKPNLPRNTLQRRDNPYRTAGQRLLDAEIIVLRRWKHLCAALAMVAALSGPWYAFNVHRYGALTGMQEARNGVGFASVIRAAPALHWPKIAYSSARAALWTGNNTFTAFSGATLGVLIAALAFSLSLWAVSRHSAA